MGDLQFCQLHVLIVRGFESVVAELCTSVEFEVRLSMSTKKKCYWCCKLQQLSCEQSASRSRVLSHDGSVDHLQSLDDCTSRPQPISDWWVGFCH